MVNYIGKNPPGILNMVLNFKKTIDEIQRALSMESGKGLHSLVLYGSMARGQAGKESDIDILLVLESESLYEKCLGIVYDIDLKNQSFTSIFWTTPTELKRHLERGSPFLENIFEEGVILFDDGTFVGIRQRLIKAGRPGA